MLAIQRNTQPGFADSAAPTASLASALPSCRLMVVDDDEWMRVYLAAVLRSAGYEVDVVYSGTEALQLLRERPYDILLTDFQMPVMDGPTLCQRVRMEFSHSSPYILMFTVKETGVGRDAALKSGANDYLNKGARRSELLTKLNEGRRFWSCHDAPARGDVPSVAAGESWIDWTAILPFDSRSAHGADRH